MLFPFISAVVIVFSFVIPGIIKALKADNKELRNANQNKTQSRNSQISYANKESDKQIRDLKDKNLLLETKIEKYQRRITKLIDRLDEAGKLN